MAVCPGSGLSSAGLSLSQQASGQVGAMHAVQTVKAAETNL